MKERHVINARQQGRAKRLAVGRDTAHAHAAKAHAMVATLTPDEDGAMALAAGPVVGQRHFQGRVRGLGARVAKQHLVEVARGQRRNGLGGLKGLVVAHLEGGGVVQRVELLLDRLVELTSVVSGPHTPQAGNAVDDLSSIVRGEVHALRTDEHTRLLAKMPVGGEGQPVVVEMKVVESHIVSMPPRGGKKPIVHRKLQ